jgi:hypothetical protein
VTGSRRPTKDIQKFQQNGGCDMESCRSTLELGVFGRNTINTRII